MTYINQRGLSDVEDRLRACADRWGLAVGEQLTGGFRSAVFAGVTAAAQEVVLKLTPTVEEAALEARALQAWSGTGVSVILIDADHGCGALLLERLRPALPLAGQDDEVIEVVAEILDRLQSLGPVPGFPSLADVFPHLARHSMADNDYERAERGEPDRGRAAMELMAAAHRTAADLCSSAPREVLLHGDLLDKNLLRSGDRYLAVDPIPRVGEPESEIGFYAADHPPAAGILERAGQLADRLEADRERATRWAAVWTVLLAASAWRDDQAELDALVASDRLSALLDR